MQITEVRVKLADDSDRLKAFCSLTFDDSFVVRDVKLIEGDDGLFIAMPSRKRMGRCSKCRCKNHLRASFCNQCGTNLPTSRVDGFDGRPRLFADVAHPIHPECREMIQKAVLDAFDKEYELSKSPDYVPSFSDVDLDESAPAVRVQREHSAPRGPHVKPEAEKTPAPASSEATTSESHIRVDDSQSPQPTAERPQTAPSSVNASEFGKGILE